MDEPLDELKKKELEILVAFVHACNRLKLTYFLIGGTLIGAIRHQGFIPWDDDIDVIMPRKDYEVFVNNAQQILPENMFVQTNKTDPEYPYCFAKVRNSNTTFIETVTKFRNINHGVYIDVFPLDNYPTNSYLQKRISFLSFMMETSISRVYNIHFSWKMKVLQSLSAVCYPSFVKTVQKRESLFKETSDSSLVRNYCGAWGEREIWESKWFGKGKTAQFEGISVNIPDDYDSVLRKVYGDYMKLPPKEKRVAHHYYDILDCSNSYVNYTRKAE